MRSEGFLRRLLQQAVAVAEEAAYRLFHPAAVGVVAEADLFQLLEAAEEELEGAPWPTVREAGAAREAAVQRQTFRPVAAEAAGALSREGEAA